MSAQGLPVGERQPGVQGLQARSRGRRSRHQRGPGNVLVTYAKKREYGTGRARLPGLEEMMATMKAESSSSGAAPSGGNSSSGGLSRPAARPGSGSRSDSGGASGSRGAAAAPPAPPSGGSGAGGDAPSLGDYLKFGRLLGDKPQAVQQQLALGATRVVVDDDSADYLQSWEEEEAEAYLMFEAVLQRQASRTAGAAANAAAKKLERNKARMSAAASAMQLERQARRDRESAGPPLSAAQRKLARNKSAGGGMGASMRASLEELMGTAGIEGDADDAFELVGRPRRPGAPAAAAPAKPAPQSTHEDDEAAEYAEWAAAAEAEFGSLEDAYQDFEARLGHAAQPPAKTKRGSKPGLAAVGELKDAVPQRPRGSAAQPPAAAPPPAGRVQLKVAQLARPPKLAAKPQASQQARAAAQRPLPPPPPPEPKLAGKPSRPAAPSAPPTPAGAPAAAVPQQPPPQLAAKPAAKPAVKPPAGRPQRQAEAEASMAAVSKPAAAAAEPPAKAAPQPVAAEAAVAEPAIAPEPAAAAPEEAASPAAAAAAPAVEAAAAPAPAGPAKPKRRAAAAATAAEPAAAAEPAVAPKPQRPPPSLPRQLKQQRMAEERERKAAEAARRAAASAELKERRERNAAYGHDRLLDRQAETLNVWQVNSAGVLVRNDNLSGFIPSSLLSPLNVAAVIEAERPLLAAAAAGAIVAQLETQGQPAQAAEGADLDPSTRAAARRQALEAVLLGQQITAQVVNVDAASGRVVLSERAAVSAWKDRGMRATPPSSAELQAAAGMLGDVVDATVVHVKPFGAFLEFQAELPSFMVAAGAAGAAGTAGAAGGSQRAVLVGLVHRSEVSWDPDVDITDALQVGQRVQAKLLHVDAAKARIFLSIRRTTANPLLETLDSLVTSAAAAAASGAGSTVGAGSGASAGAEGAPAAAAAALLDERPSLGDLPEAVRFCELLAENGRGAVLSTKPGVRLQSRAASQELEVYLAKDAAAGIGAAVAAVGGTTEPHPSAAAIAGAATFNMVLRCARTVQEVAVVATCSREEVRQLIGTTIAQLAAELEAAADEGA